MVARIIHQASRRRDRPLVSINCAAIPDSLFESELFGFERSAFTGADVARAGKLELADGGTVFLDEVGDMSPPAQAKILRAINVPGTSRAEQLRVLPTHEVERMPAVPIALAGGA